MDDLVKEQLENCPHLKVKKTAEPAPEPAPVKVPEPAKKEPEPKKEEEVEEDVKSKDFLELYCEQMNILIKASEETKQNVEKLHCENRTMNGNMVKLLRRVETLETKVESSSNSIPEF